MADTDTGELFVIADSDDAPGNDAVVVEQAEPAPAQVKPKKAKKEMSPEAKAELIERLRAGKKAAAERRKTKAAPPAAAAAAPVAAAAAAPAAPTRPRGQRTETDLAREVRKMRFEMTAYREENRLHRAAKAEAAARKKAAAEPKAKSPLAAAPAAPKATPAPKAQAFEEYYDCRARKVKRRPVKN
jgi:hypothetical protein